MRSSKFSRFKKSLKCEGSAKQAPFYDNMLSAMCFLNISVLSVKIKPYCLVLTIIHCHRVAIS